jgi:DNA-binding protein H-NS
MLTLAVIERRIRALQAKAEKLRVRDKKPALNEIAGLMKEHDISIAEVRAIASGRAKRRANGRGNGASTLRGRKVKPMYKNPKTGETWSGRGRTAGWLAALEKAGRKREQFLIK